MNGSAVALGLFAVLAGACGRIGFGVGGGGSGVTGDGSGVTGDGSGAGFSCPSGSGPLVVLSPASILAGTDVVLDGCRFGAKAHAAPLIWDDFEGGVAGDPLDAHSSWTPYVNAGARYSNAASYAGSLSAFNQGTDTYDTSYQDFAPSSEVYVSYHLRYEQSAAPTNGSLFLSRVTSDYAGPVSHTPKYSGPGTTAWTYQLSTGWSYFWYEAGSNSPQTTFGAFNPGQWRRIEMYTLLSTPGQPDGDDWMGNAGSFVQQPLLVTRDAGFTFQLDSITLGLMIANVTGATITSYIDDVYVDDTQARVELGDQPDFASCTRREIQIPTAWSDGQVHVTARRGQFQPSDTAYLFVVDRDGVASPGVAVVVN